MKKSLFTHLIILLSVCSFAQNFQGIAYYSSQTQMKNFDFSMEGMTPDVKEQMMEKMRKAFEKTYILTFTKSESIFQEEEKLAAPKPNSGGVNVEMALSGGTDSKFYKDFKKKQYITDLDIFGKEFLVTDVLEKFDWKITNEQKKIGIYTCSKAEIMIPVTAEEIKNYDELKKKQESNTTSFFVLSEPKEKSIEAWYTMEIPVSNGPGKYWGLPGLILEIHEGETTFLCSKIVLNTEEKIEIKAPKNGKKVSQKEYNEIEKKKLESMTNGDGVIEIRMD